MLFTTAKIVLYHICYHNMYDILGFAVYLYHNIYDMKRLIFLFVFSLGSLSAFSQKGRLSTKAIRALADAYNYQFQYGRDMFKVVAMEAARKIGIYEVSDMQEAVQNLNTSTDFRNSLLRVMGSYSGYQYSLIYSTLYGMGIDRENSNILAVHIISLGDSKSEKILLKTKLEVKKNGKLDTLKSRVRYQDSIKTKIISTQIKEINNSSNKEVQNRNSKVYSLKELKENKHLIDTKIGSKLTKVFAKLTNGIIIEVKNKQFPEEVETTYNLINGPNGQTLALIEINYGADHYTQITHYFEKGGKTFAINVIHNFYDGAGKIASWEKTTYFDNKFDIISTLETLKDKQNKKIKIKDFVPPEIKYYENRALCLQPFDKY